MIIDAHMHFGYNSKRYIKDYSVECLLNVMDSLNITKGISISTSNAGGEYEQGALDSKELFERTEGRIYSYFRYGPHLGADAIKVMEKYSDDPTFVAIKLHPPGDRLHADHEKYRPVWEFASAHKLPIMSHTWAKTHNPNQVYALPELFVKYIEDYPDVTFIYGHSGGRPDGLRTAVEIGKTHPNTMFDIAGDIWSHGFLEYLVDGVGADRVIYGSDYSMMDARLMLGVIAGSDLSAEQKECILYKNAARTFGI